MKMKYLYTLLLACCFWACAALAIAVVNMPHNPLKGSKKNMNAVLGLTQQGWAFFTKSSKESQIYIYQEVDGRLVEQPYANARPESWFGFNRYVRAKGFEVGNLFERSANMQWYECEDDVNSCQNWDTIPAQDILNPTYTSQLCGEFYIVHRPITPWAWSRSGKEIHMPSKVIKLNAICLEK